MENKMHWVVQQNIFKPENFNVLISALVDLNVPHTAVTIPSGELKLQPDVHPVGKVYVCGAIKMAKIALAKGWEPGSFLNDQFRYDLWLEKLGPELLNHDCSIGKFADINVDQFSRFFIRPLEDNKAFDGMVLDAEMLTTWRQDPLRTYLLNVDVILSPVREIYREYRLFVVGKEVITGSLYKVAGRPQVSDLVEPDVIEYVNKIVDKWLPIESCVIDVCLTEDGWKVIEFNNINSSSFYASNVHKYVAAIQACYS
jgi:hypothetical protein